MYRNTYVEIDLDNIKYNIELIKNNNSDYKYYIGVVKADCYGHYGNETIKAIIDGGCNYLAVSSLEEALEILKKHKIGYFVIFRLLGIYSRAMNRKCRVAGAIIPTA